MIFRAKRLEKTGEKIRKSSIRYFVKLKVWRVLGHLYQCATPFCLACTCRIYQGAALPYLFAVIRDNANTTTKIFIFRLKVKLGVFWLGLCTTDLEDRASACISEFIKFEISQHAEKRGCSMRTALHLSLAVVGKMRKMQPELSF